METIEATVVGAVRCVMRSEVGGLRSEDAGVSATGAARGGHGSSWGLRQG